MIDKKRQWSDLSPIKIKEWGGFTIFGYFFSDFFRFHPLPSICRTLLCVSILNWRVVVSLLYSRLGCFLIFTTAGIKCVVRERHMRPAGQIGSHALSLNQSTTSGFVLFCVSLMPCLLINPPVHLRLCFSRICICLNPVSRIPINPPPAALFISVFGFQYLPLYQSSTNIYRRCQTKKDLRGAGIMNFQVQIKAQGWPNYAGTF